jgi:hypothetical protein
MKKQVLILGILLLLAISCAEDAVKPTSDGKIIGFVFDSKTMLPIKNAQVYSEPATETVITNDSGYFYLGNTNPGNYRIIATEKEYYSSDVTVFVKAGKESRAYIKLSSKFDENLPPETPSIISPIKGITTNKNSITVTWACSDPNDDKLTYDVFIDSINPPAKKVANRIKNTSYIVDDLADSTEYYIKIIAYDIYEASTESDITNFKINRSFSKVEEGLILYLPFNDNADDNGPNSLETTSSNLTFGNDRHGNKNSAVSFNGLTSDVKIASPQTNIQNNYSILFWCYINTTQGKTDQTDNDIFGKWGAISPGQASYIFYLYNGNTLYYRVSNGSSYALNVSTIVPLKENWFHIAITCENGTITLYLNGVKNTSIQNSVAQNSNIPLTIGGRYNGSSRFSGMIDDFMIYSNALSAEVIELIANE